MRPLAFLRVVVAVSLVVWLARDDWPAVFGVVVVAVWLVWLVVEVRDMRAEDRAADCAQVGRIVCRQLSDQAPYPGAVQAGPPCEMAFTCSRAGAHRSNRWAVPDRSHRTNP